VLTDAGPATQSRPFTVKDRSSQRNVEATLAWAGWVVVAVGCALRVREYVANRSLGVDEALLALNLIEKSPRELLGGLAFEQAAPLAFLQVQKAAIAFLGPSEYALRLLPLIASLLAVVLFYRVAQRVLRPGAATLAVAVFAFLDPLVLYSATTKQYAFDVAAAVLILAIATLVDERRLSETELIAIGALGATVLWFSHAAVFGLAALSALLLVRALTVRTRRLTAAVSAVIAVWVASFAAHFLLSRAGIGSIVRAFERGGGEAFEPAGDGSDWLAETLDRARYLVGLEETSSGQAAIGSFDPALNRGLTLLVVGVGVLGFVSVVRRNRALALMLSLPPMLAVLASALGEYPLVGRTILFALPSVAICVGEGAACLFRASTTPRRAPLGGLAVAALVAVALVSVTHVLEPRESQGMREALGDLRANSKSGDALYVSPGAQYTFAYYSLCQCAPFDPSTRWPFSTLVEAGDSVAVRPRSPDLIVGSDGGTEDVRRLEGRKRAWFLLAELDADERSELVDRLEADGKLLHRFESDAPLPARASTFLVDLSPSR